MTVKVEGDAGAGYRFRVTAEMLAGGGKRYEDTYGGYLQFFAAVAQLPKQTPVTVHGAPWSWVPLLRWLNCKVLECVHYFHHCTRVCLALDANVDAELTRTEVEALCCFRPETVDALWKCDAQWKTERPVHRYEREFIVTSNGSFWREEVLQYLRHVEPPTRNGVPLRNVVLVPCAADKPYPAPVHAAVMKMLPRGWYLANLTGVLGIVPYTTWPSMPYYDSGIPNEWRLTCLALEYFKQHRHDNIIVYADYYNLAIQAADGWSLSVYGHSLARERLTFVNDVTFYADYLDLLDPQRLDALRAAIRAC